MSWRVVRKKQKLTMIGWLACGIGKADSSSSSVSGGGGLGGTVSWGSGGRGGASEKETALNLTLEQSTNKQLSFFSYPKSLDTETNEWIQCFLNKKGENDWTHYFISTTYLHCLNLKCLFSKQQQKWFEPWCHVNRNLGIKIKFFLGGREVKQ